jgi:hypothetical protein
MRAILRLGLVSALLLAAACAGVSTSRPLYDALGDRSVRIEARTTPLGPVGASLAEGVTYAGGLTLRGSALHGLSDLKMEGDTAWIVSDFGTLIRMRLTTSRSGRLTGAVAATARPLVDPDGAVLTPKPRADAEGIALLEDGSVLVSFERDHRIWNYGPAGTGRPIPVPHPAVAFADNGGMEGLAAARSGGWLVLGEEGGGWVCRPGGCVALPAYPATGDDGFRVTGADRDPSGGWFIVERSFSPPVDMRARVRRLSGDGTPGPVLIALRPPAAVDNMEGIAAVSTPQGTRLYLLSDDNDNPLQRTLLLAFDLAR